MSRLRAKEGAAARALEFTALTAARSGEVFGARWAEIDTAARLWAVPASRMKASKEHRVPLSDRELAILAALPRDSEYVFPSDTTAYPVHVIELCLAHAVGSAVERSYARSDLLDRRRRLMADWAAFCERAPVAAESNVVAMREPA